MYGIVEYIEQNYSDLNFICYACYTMYKVQNSYHLKKKHKVTLYFISYSRQ